jgi:hypothetical protein
VQRARERATALIAEYQPPDVPAEVRKELKAVMAGAARQYGMDELPPLPEPQSREEATCVNRTGGFFTVAKRNAPSHVMLTR